MTLDVEDSTNTVFDGTSVPSGGWTEVSGVENGVIYIYITSLSGLASVTAQVDAF
jgi:hypothetical protein